MNINRAAKKLLLSVTLLFLILLPNSVNATYNPLDRINNKVGVHILHPEELESAAQLVNSNGGEWGYVTIPIQAKERDKVKWQAFMQSSKNNKVIPILRITTIPHGGTWSQGMDTDLVDFANFLNELDWPTKNRYVIIFNEVNRASEWGGIVDPEKYAFILKNAYTIFKQRSEDFFILPAGLDLALPNSETSQSAKNYLSRMQTAIPEIWNYIDGWSSHSYPNPAFSASPFKTGWLSIQGYKQELSYTQNQDKPVFITETGWDKTKLSQAQQSSFYKSAFSIWNKDPNIIAVTPFVLNAQDGDFAKFSLIENDDSQPFFNAIESIRKTKGDPEIAEPVPTNPPYTPVNYSGNNPIFSPSIASIKLENFFRQIFNLPLKRIIKINNRTITVEVVTTPSQLSKGLSGRFHLGNNHGMLFIFNDPHIPRFWMKDMQFSIDIIWTRNDTITQITSDVPITIGNNLPTYSPSDPIDKVLELNAGYAKKNNIEVGDTIKYIF